MPERDGIRDDIYEAEVEDSSVVRRDRDDVDEFQVTPDEVPVSAGPSGSSAGSPIGTSGPVLGVTLPETTIEGPPAWVLSDPALLSGWQDMRDGWITAEAAQAPTGNPSEAFWAGYHGYFSSTSVTGPAVEGPIEGSTPFTSTQEDAILEWLHAHKEDPHTHVEGEPGPPPQPNPVTYVPD